MQHSISATAFRRQCEYTLKCCLFGLMQKANFLHLRGMKLSGLRAEYRDDVTTVHPKAAITREWPLLYFYPSYSCVNCFLLLPQTGVGKPAGAAGAARRQLQVTQVGRAQLEILKYYILHFG